MRPTVTGKLHLRYSEDHDWIAVYLDGKKLAEGHSFDEKLLLDVLGVIYTWDHVDRETANYGDGFPETLGQEKEADPE